MSKFLLRIEATETRIASYSCPRKAAGRIHALRLRRLFRPYTRSHWGSAARIRDKFAPKIVPIFQSKDNFQTKTDRDVPDSSTRARDGLERNDRHSSLAHLPASIDPQSQTTGERSHLSSLERARYGDLGWTITSNNWTLGDAEWANSSTGKMSELVQASIDSLHAALRTGNPHSILEAAIELVRVGERSLTRPFASLPSTTFSEILRCLDPDTLVGRYLNIHKEISAKNSAMMDALSEDTLNGYRFCETFMSKVQMIVKQRNGAGLNLSLPDCKFLLRCARIVGNRKIMHNIWRTMDREGITPDMDCYNHYFATLVWSDVVLPHQRHNVRVTPRHLGLRQQSQLPKGLRGHAGELRGIKSRVTYVFNEMVRNGVVANEETFCLMIIAFAREGDVDSIKSVLEKVWGIDVAKLMKGEDATAPTKFVGHDSPLRPSEKLLMSLAHAYGVNNSIPMAMRLVDYVSRHYGLDIPVKVWDELLERTYVLTRRRTVAQRKRGDATGQLPSDAVRNLWTTLVEPPYNIKPTMHMYDKIIMDLIMRQSFSNAQKLMEEAYNSQNNIRRAWLATNLAPESVKPDRMERDRTFLSLRVHRNDHYYRRWCQQLLLRGSKSLGPAFSLRTIANIVEKWERYVPIVMDYDTMTGRVSLKVKDDGDKDVEMTENSQSVSDQEERSGNEGQAMFDDDDIL